MTFSTRLPIDRALKRLGIQISQARRRRRWSQQDMAEQMGVSLSTVRRMERGHPGTALQHLMNVLFVLGQLDRFAALLEAPQDTIGMLSQDENLPRRIRRGPAELA